jgi:hypothetical protein
MFARTSTNSTKIVPDTTSLLHSSIKSSILALVMNSYPSWMDSLATTKSKSARHISKKVPSQPRGHLFLLSHAFRTKNVGATFQRTMTYALQDLTHIILTYLDDVTAQSKKCSQHIEDLKIIFERCRKNNIRLNPLKCVFCVTTGRLLGFIVSQQGITIDPIKFHAINEIHPPRNLCQLQSLHGKPNFLRCFVPYYAIGDHDFLHLLLRDIPFHWDRHAQASFDSIKEAHIKSPLISPLDYDMDYILYLSISDISVAGVLIQVDDDQREHVI